MVQSDIYLQIHSKKDEIIGFAGTYGASHIRIFGSVAHHTPDENSDIDFLVDLEPVRTLFDLGGFAYNPGKLLSPTGGCLYRAITTRTDPQTGRSGSGTPMRNDRVRFQDMTESITKIEKYTSSERRAF